MNRDEVAPATGPGGWGLILLVAVVAALFSMLSQPQKNVPPTSVALPTATAVATTAPAPPAPTHAPPTPLDPTQAALQLQRGFVSAQTICPVSTDHRTSLAISLVLRNDSKVTEHIEALAPALPLGGLVDKGAVIRSGSCDVPFGKPVRPAGQVLPAGTTMLVTLHLGLPKTCPQPLPVELNVTLSIHDDVRSEQLPLFNDLGATAFDSCHPQH